MVTAACAVAVGIALMRGVSGPGVGRETAGALAADHRESVALGRRGVAVVEAGAALAWTVTDASARVEHRAGSAFYRIEPGGAFTVVAAGAEIRAAAACITVAVTGAAAGVEVIVHQGSAVVVTAGIERPLVAGDRIAVGSELAPSPSPRP